MKKNENVLLVPDSEALWEGGQLGLLVLEEGKSGVIFRGGGVKIPV